MAEASTWCMGMWPAPGLSEFEIVQTHHRMNRPYPERPSSVATPVLISLTFIQKDMMRIVRLKSSTLPALLASTVAAAMKRTYVGLPACDWKICASSMCEVIHDDLLYE